MMDDVGIPGANRSATSRLLSGVIYAMTTLLGVMAFLYPFWLPALAQGDGMGMAHASDAPLMMTLSRGALFRGAAVGSAARGHGREDAGAAWAFWWR